MKKLTIPEAWADFWAHIKASPQWGDIPRQDKQYLYKARAAANAGTLGIHRLRMLADKYAPGRYRFQVEESVYLND